VECWLVGDGRQIETNGHSAREECVNGNVRDFEWTAVTERHRARLISFERLVYYLAIGRQVGKSQRGVASPALGIWPLIRAPDLAHATRPRGDERLNFGLCACDSKDLHLIHPANQIVGVDSFERSHSQRPVNICDWICVGLVSTQLNPE